MFSKTASDINMIGLAMIPIVMVLAVCVVSAYWPRLELKRWREWTPVEHLMLGIVITFGVPNVFNVAWWGAHFLAAHYHWQPVHAFTWEWGQAANIVTRYLPYVISPLYHLHAAHQQGVKGVHHPWRYAALGVVLTLGAYTLLRLTSP